MKKLLLLSVCLVFVGITIAEEKPVNLLNSLQQSSWEIGPEAYYYQYKEPGLMKLTGYFWGVQAAYTYREWVPIFPTDDVELNKWMFRAEGRYAWGIVDYDGALMDGTPYSYNNKQDSIGEFRLLFGPDFLKADVVDTLYGGLGYRRLNDDRSGDPHGYDRQSQYLYVPVGFKTLRNLAADWLISANAEFDIFVWGSQYSDLGGTTLRNNQEKGYGIRGSVDFEYNTKETDILIQPFIRYWKIDDSEVNKYGFYEPKNNTTEIGLDLILRF